jgi:hypothetical protein
MAATPRQLQVIDDLVEQLGLNGQIKDVVYRVASSPACRPAHEIRDLISGLIERQRRARSAARQAAPAERPTNAVPGYYVRADGVAIKVVTNREGTRTYGKRFVPPTTPGKRPEWRYEAGLGISVAELTPMTAAEAAAIGLSHGHCIQCLARLGGASLSAAVSAKIGYGETCAKRNGWPYPTGRAAQQAYLDAASV